MPRLHQPNQPIFIDMRRRTVQRMAEPTFCHDEIQPRQDIQISADLCRKVHHDQGKRAQNGGNLLFFFMPQYGKLVIQLHHRQRLDEDRRTGAAHIMGNAGDLPAIFLLHRHDETTISYRDDGILQKTRRIGVAN